MADKAQAQLFEYAILHHPTTKKGEPAARSVIAVEPTRVLAKTRDEAAIHAARAIPATLIDRVDELEILVRPF